MGKLHKITKSYDAAVETLWLVKEIARSLRKLSSHVLLIVSIHECPAQYCRLILLVVVARDDADGGIGRCYETHTLVRLIQ
jgi:hypothetical protein